MAYATAQDMIDRFEETVLKQVTDPEAQEIQGPALTRSLEDASDEIDGYLQSRYTLPLDPAPRILRILSSNIAMYRLLVLRPLGDIEDARKRYEDAIKFLTRVAAGEVSLGLSEDAQVAAESGGPQVAGPARTFSRDTLKGF